MKLLFLSCAALPVIVAQQPLTLYNGANPETANCAAKTSACDCHYASCSLTGDCACGWDDATSTCKRGIPTKCVSCPAMRRCGVNEPLKIGPDGFPVPGQLSVWGSVPYPDQSGSTQPAPPQYVGQTQFSQASWQPQRMPVTQTQQWQPQMQFGAQAQFPQASWYQLPQASWQPATQVFGQAQTQPYWQTQATWQTQPSTTTQVSWQSQPSTTTQMSWQQPSTSAQVSWQTQPSTTAQASWQSQASTTQSSQFSSAQQAPLSLYQDNAISARSCSTKTSACDCHYASCTPNGDCICGWDATSQTCRAGIPTQCVSCPAMHRCGTSEKLKIGPDGFPVPGQLSVWGNVPYPDQSGNAK